MSNTFTLRMINNHHSQSRCQWSAHASLQGPARRRARKVMTTEATGRQRCRWSAAEEWRARGDEASQMGAARYDWGAWIWRSARYEQTEHFANFGWMLRIGNCISPAKKVQKTRLLEWELNIPGKGVMSSEVSVHSHHFIRQWLTTACHIQFAQHFRVYK